VSAERPLSALGLILRFHRRYRWWDQDFIPRLAALTAQWPCDWRQEIDRRRELVEAAQTYLEGQQGMAEPDAAPLVPHALACAASWALSRPAGR
jgi:hypothetical protein